MSDELKLRVSTKTTGLTLFRARDIKMFRNISLSRKMIVDLPTTLGLIRIECYLFIIIYIAAVILEKMFSAFPYKTRGCGRMRKVAKNRPTAMFCTCFELFTTAMVNIYFL